MSHVIRPFPIGFGLWSSIMQGQYLRDRLRHLLNAHENDDKCRCAEGHTCGRCEEIETLTEAIEEIA